MNFSASVEYLYNLGNEVLAMKLGLENIGKLLAALGNPHTKYLKVQVAGTNGKGSTCAFLESICIQAGIEVGTTTSPHLICVTERIKINGHEISEKDFARHATLIRKTGEELVELGELETVPTFFEQVTAIALNAFAEARIELAILETGLGGRFDATTAANAEIVAITPIDYDHQRILGETLTEIAAEKAAIIRSDTRVISVIQQKEAENVIYGKCRENKIDPIWAAPNFKLIEDLGGDLQYLSFQTKNAHYKPELSLRGKHQRTNANLAIYIAENLSDYGFDISKDDIVTGLETARHSGRLEYCENILFDGAHNISGAKALREYLDESIDQPLIMIFGAMTDKDLSEIAAVLFPKAENLILTVPDNPRSMQVSELQKYAYEMLPDDRVFLTENVADALKTARALTNDSDLILVTGSLYLVGEALKIIKSNS